MGFQKKKKKSESARQLVFWESLFLAQLRLYVNSKQFAELPLQHCWRYVSEQNIMLTAFGGGEGGEHSTDWFCYFCKSCPVPEV
jgi:hypothetical protein